MRENKEKNMEEKILQHAEKLFLEKGFASTSTTEIAKEVGCNQALVHYYFRTKENLFLQIFIKKAQSFFAVFTEIDSSNDDFLTKLRHKIEIHFDLIVQNPNLPSLILNELISSQNHRSGVFEEIVRNFVNSETFQKMDAELKQEIEKGNIRQITTIDLIMNMISLNVYSILFSSVYQNIAKITDEQKEAFLVQRKTEIINVLLKSLKP